MNSNTRYVIECRDVLGNLDFTGRQPEHVFGMDAITGITEDRMAKVVFAHCGDHVTLDGRFVTDWPALIDGRWTCRKKTW